VACMTEVRDDSISSTASKPPSSNTSCAMAKEEDLAAEAEADMLRKRRAANRSRKGF
jgi:hypothetical protein